MQGSFLVNYLGFRFFYKKWRCEVKIEVFINCGGCLLGKIGSFKISYKKTNADQMSKKAG